MDDLKNSTRSFLQHNFTDVICTDILSVGTLEAVNRNLPRAVKITADEKKLPQYVSGNRFNYWLNRRHFESKFDGDESWISKDTLTSCKYSKHLARHIFTDSRAFRYPFIDSVLQIQLEQMLTASTVALSNSGSILIVCRWRLAHAQYASSPLTWLQICRSSASEDSCSRREGGELKRQAGLSHDASGEGETTGMDCLIEIMADRWWYTTYGRAVRG